MAGTKKEADKEYSKNWGGARKNSGGKREGAGRPRLSESGRKQVQFSLSQEILDIITEFAKKNGTTKSGFVVECIKFYIENHR